MITVKYFEAKKVYRVYLNDKYAATITNRQWKCESTWYIYLPTYGKYWASLDATIYSLTDAVGTLFDIELEEVQKFEIEIKPEPFDIVL